MTLTTYNDLEQGSGDWHDLRRGMVTASVVDHLITRATLKPANNDTSRALTLHLVAERITGHTEETYVSADMERGTFDEPIARDHYSEHCAPVIETGFMVLEENGHRLGYSPDGLVGEDGLIEVKSRRQKAQLKTFLADTVPAENMGQIQCGLLVSGRDWCDYLSWCGGMPMYVKRVLPDPRWFAAIREALAVFETTAAEMIAAYELATAGKPTTERVLQFEEMRI